MTTEHRCGGRAPARALPRTSHGTTLPAMRSRPRSALARFVHALTALVTVWCLGCSAFEPLVGGLLGGEVASEMTCGGDPAPAGTASVQAADAGRGASIGAPASHDARGYDCGCQSCHAPSPRVASASIPRAAAASAESATARSFLSIEREPLVPPPQAAP